MPPVLQQPRGLGSDAPVIGVGKFPPLIDLLTNRIDDGRVVVTLFLRGKFVEQQGLLFGRTFALFRLGDRRDEIRATAGLDDLLRRLAGSVEFPMTQRVVVRRIEDRLFEKLVVHIRHSWIIA